MSLETRKWSHVTGGFFKKVELTIWKLYTSNYVDHFLRYYALKFSDREIDFSQKTAGHMTSFSRL